MADIGYVWDEDKYELVQQKHGVLFWEVVSAFEDIDCYEDEDPQGNEGCWMLVGRSTSDRILRIIFSDEEFPLIRLITAFDAEQEYRDEYYTRQGLE